MATSTLKVIPRMSLKDVAVQRIREAIQNGELRSGDQITELGLAKNLGVAQPTIREALLELEFNGFVERIGPRKTRVTVLTRRAIDDIYLVRSRLELLAVELVAAQESPDLKHCREQAARMEASARVGNLQEFWQADLEFHRALWQSSGNESLHSSLERLVPKLFAFAIIRRARPTAKQRLEVAREHRQLLNLIAARDTAAAQRLMAAAMESARRDDDQLSG